MQMCLEQCFIIFVVIYLNKRLESCVKISHYDKIRYRVFQIGWFVLSPHHTKSQSSKLFNFVNYPLMKGITAFYSRLGGMLDSRNQLIWFIMMLWLYLDSSWRETIKAVCAAQNNKVNKQKRATINFMQVSRHHKSQNNEIISKFRKLK